MEDVEHLIPLKRKGRFYHAVVDREDWERLRVRKWYPRWNPKTRSWYAYRNCQRRKGHPAQSMLMSREILGLEIGDIRQVDHIDHHTLNNRRSNLRIVTQRENSSNRRDQSRFGVGVWRANHTFTHPFFADIQVDGKKIRFGGFATAKEAREARRRFLEEHDGH